MALRLFASSRVEFRSGSIWRREFNTFGVYVVSMFFGFMAAPELVDLEGLGLCARNVYSNVVILCGWRHGIDRSLLGSLFCEVHGP